MDQNREIRFLIPPVVFLLSVLWGSEQNIYQLFPSLFEKTLSDIATIIVAVLFGGTSVIALGFIISSISIFFLDLLNRFFHWDIEPITDKALRHFLKVLRVEYGEEYDQKLYAVGVIHHGLINKRSPSLSDWISRRWNMFTVSVNCLVAIILSASIGTGYQIVHLINRLDANLELWNWNVFLLWWLPHLVLLLIFSFNACNAHREITKMFSFIAQQTTREDGEIRISLLA